MAAVIGPANDLQTISKRGPMKDGAMVGWANMVDKMELETENDEFAGNNILSICRNGILSHTCAREIPHSSIAKPEVIEIRKSKRIPQGRPLFDYAILYFNPRNPMMCKVTDGGKNIGHLCIFKVDRELISTENAIISDGNAASDYTKFYPAPNGLGQLIKEEVFIKYWNDDDPIRRLKLKRATCAELLVPDRIGPEYLYAITIPSMEAATAIRDKIGRLRLDIDKTPFFG